MGGMVLDTIVATRGAFFDVHPEKMRKGWIAIFLSVHAVHVWFSCSSFAAIHGQSHFVVHPIIGEKVNY